MSKKIIIGREARDKLLEAAKLAHDTVCVTLGPKGRNVGLQRLWGGGLILHDGVSVMREVESDDEFVQLGLGYIREAAEKTVQGCGDATTTTTLLAYHIIREGFTLIDKGTNPMGLRDQVTACLPSLLEELKRITIPVTSQKDVEKIAAISSADKAIGVFVGEAVYKLGKTGLVSVDESYTGETELIYTEGMQWDKGYASPLFITNLGRMEAVMRNPDIIITTKKITAVNEILPITEHLARKGHKSIVFIGDISGEALNFLVQNKIRGNINCLVIDAEGLQERRVSNLQDIACLVGANVLDDELSIGFAKYDEKGNPTNIDMQWFGTAKTVVATKDTTAIIEGGGSKKAIADRIAVLTEQTTIAPNIYAREVLEERIARLTTGAAVIKVGGKSEMEMKERLERVKDAVGAAKAALAEGIVPGGGVSFLRLNDLITAKKTYTQGEEVLSHALKQPFIKLLENAGIEPHVVLDHDKNMGYNVASGKIENLLEGGVIDPAKAIRLALEHSVSVATSILTCEALIAIKKEPQQNETQN